MTIMSKLKARHYKYETIAGEPPVNVPDTHVLVRSEAIAEGIKQSYYIVPKEVWTAWERAREVLLDSIELVYCRDEHYSPSTSVFTAVPYTYNARDFRVPDGPYTEEEYYEEEEDYYG